MLHLTENRETKNQLNSIWITVSKKLSGWNWFYLLECYRELYRLARILTPLWVVCSQRSWIQVSWKLIDVAKAQVSTSHAVNVAVQGAFILKYVPLFWYSRTGRAVYLHKFNARTETHMWKQGNFDSLLCSFCCSFSLHILRLNKCLCPSKLAKIERIAWKKYPR